MDKEVRFILNDLTDVVEQLTKIVRELNPGANYGLIEFMLARIDRQLNDILEAAGPRA
jgi:hypothetical protein